MLYQSIWVCLLVATFAVNAKVIPTIEDALASTRNHTIAEGRISVDNVLIHTEVMHGESVIYNTFFVEVISRIEVIDLDGLDSDAPHIYGGVGEHFVQIIPFSDYENNEANNSRYLVNIYKTVENREIFRGQLNSRSKIIHTAVFDDQTTFYGKEIITAFHIEALTEESVSSLLVVGGVYHNFLFVVPSNNETSEEDKRTDDTTGRFKVTIYYEEQRLSNDFVHGNLTPESVFIAERRVTGADLVEGSFQYSTNTWQVTQVRFYDQTNGYGGSVISVGVLPQVVNIKFEEEEGIDFIVQFFGERRNKS